MGYFDLHCRSRRRRRAYADISRRQTDSFQPFTGSLGNIGAAAVTRSGDGNRPFAVAGKTFPTIKAALKRTCDIQNNQCSDAAKATGNSGPLTVSACHDQRCKSKSKHSFQDCASLIHLQHLASRSPLSQQIHSLRLHPCPTRLLLLHHRYLIQYLKALPHLK